MSTVSVLIKCIPFLGLAGIGIYMLVVSLVPSWREQGWKQWTLYNTYNKGNLDSLGRTLGFAKPLKASAKVELSNKAASRSYFLVGLIILLIAFLGIRHFSGVPEGVPDLLQEKDR